MQTKGETSCKQDKNRETKGTYAEIVGADGGVEARHEHLVGRLHARAAGLGLHKTDKDPSSNATAQKVSIGGEVISMPSVLTLLGA
jgi:hypothetical protein